MKKNINKFPTMAAYMAANLSADEPRVSLVEGEVITQGVNVVLPILRGLLRIGDHLVYDKVDKCKKIIRREGFNLALLDTDRYADGKAVYFGDIDDRPFFFGVEALGSYPFSQYSRSKLTGFDLENGGSAEITATNFSCSFSYASGATYAEIATAMTAAKTGSYASYVTFEALEDGVGIKSWPTNITVVSGDLTLAWQKAIKADGTEVDGKMSYDTLANYCDLTEIGYLFPNMMDTDTPTCQHKAQYIEYVRTLASATTFGSETEQFMNKATFDDCANGHTGGADGIALYNKYNGDWFAYADVCASLRMANYDVPRQTAETLRTGEYATKQLAAVKLTEFDGTLLNAFPGPAAANAYGITVAGFETGLEAGNWHELGAGEISRILRLAKSRTSTLDADDVLNHAIVDGGGTAIVGNTTCQLCGAYYVNNQLFYYGASGYLDGSSRVSGNAVRVALALEYENS